MNGRRWSIFRQLDGMFSFRAGRCSGEALFQAMYKDRDGVQKTYQGTFAAPIRHVTRVGFRILYKQGVGAIA